MDPVAVHYTKLALQSALAHALRQGDNSALAAMFGGTSPSDAAKEIVEALDQFISAKIAVAATQKANEGK